MEDKIKSPYDMKNQVTEIWHLTMLLLRGMQASPQETYAFSRILKIVDSLQKDIDLWKKERNELYDKIRDMTNGVAAAVHNGEEESNSTTQK